MTSVPLPIHAVRAELEAALAAGPVVVSSPTGSGKSTEVPRWASALGRVLVVEPRRVACKSLAARVAELEATRLGEGVGYVVRDEAVYTDATRIVFATPGIVLHARGFADAFDVLVLDELHERSLDLDLLLGLFARAGGRPRLIVASATLDGDRVAAHLGGRHVAAEGRTHPVDVRYLDGGAALPRAEDLVPRIASAIERARDDAGDVLVFLPGKGEIDACARALRASAFDVLTMHGGLSLDEQRRAFERTSRRKLVLATNVAETSITLPGVGVVIDSGLVRRTRYHAGRGFLALAPIAEDSASQRAGRAGRTGPGVCYRLWGSHARLEKATPPEIHRESLVPMVLGAATWGRRLVDLPLLDAPRPHAIESAHDELRALGAFDEAGALTARGGELYGLPLDAPLARWLVEARGAEHVEDVIDLVAALSVGRPLFLPGAPTDEGLRRGDCDATAWVAALREGRSDEDGLSAVALGEARRVQRRLRATFGLDPSSTRRGFDRDAVLATVLAADPRAAYVVRTHGRKLAFANGGTELELGRESLVTKNEKLEAIVVLESRAIGAGSDARVLVTCASPIASARLVQLGFGRDRLASVTLERGVVLATIERVHARRVLATREEAPSGELAREAIATLFLRGSLFKGVLPQTRERLAMAALAVKLGHGEELDAGVVARPAIEDWVPARIAELGIESAEDLALLSPNDLLAPDLPFHLRSKLESDYPRTVSVGDAVYEATYELEHARVLLRMIRGSRNDAPPLSYLPRFAGLGIVVSGPRGTTVLRQRG